MQIDAGQQRLQDGGVGHQVARLERRGDDPVARSAHQGLGVRLQDVLHGGRGGLHQVVDLVVVAVTGARLQLQAEGRAPHGLGRRLAEANDAPDGTGVDGVAARRAHAVGHGAEQTHDGPVRRRTRPVLAEQLVHVTRLGIEQVGGVVAASGHLERWTGPRRRAVCGVAVVPPRAAPVLGVGVTRGHWTTRSGKVDFIIL